MRSNLDGDRSGGKNLQMRMGYQLRATAAAVTLTALSPPVVTFTPTASHDVTLPDLTAAGQDGLFYCIENKAAALSGFDLTIKNSAGTAIATVRPQCNSMFIGKASNTTWGVYNGGGQSGIDGGNLMYSTSLNVVGTIPVIHRVTVAAGALGNTDVTLTYKTRVIDAWLVLTGAGVATTTLQVKNGASAVSDAMAASGSIKAVVRAATLDMTTADIAAGGTLRVTSATGATQPDAIVFVKGLLMP